MNKRIRVAKHIFAPWDTRFGAALKISSTLSGLLRIGEELQQCIFPCIETSIAQPIFQKHAPFQVKMISVWADLYLQNPSKDSETTDQKDFQYNMGKSFALHIHEPLKARFFPVHENCMEVHTHFTSKNGRKALYEQLFVLRGQRSKPSRERPGFTDDGDRQPLEHKRPVCLHSALLIRDVTHVTRRRGVSEARYLTLQLDTSDPAQSVQRFMASLGYMPTNQVIRKGIIYCSKPLTALGKEQCLRCMVFREFYLPYARFGAVLTEYQNPGLTLDIASFISTGLVDSFCEFDGSLDQTVAAQVHARLDNLMGIGGAEGAPESVSETAAATPVKAQFSSLLRPARGSQDGICITIRSDAVGDEAGVDLAVKAVDSLKDELEHTYAQ